MLAPKAAPLGLLGPLGLVMPGTTCSERSKLMINQDVTTFVSIADVGGTDS